MKKVRACQLQMMGKQPWEYTGITHLAFISGNPVETNPQTPDASMAPPAHAPEPELPDPLNAPIPIAQPNFFQDAFNGNSVPQPGKITAIRDPTTGTKNNFNVPFRVQIELAILLFIVHYVWFLNLSKVSFKPTRPKFQQWHKQMSPTRPRRASTCQTAPIRRCRKFLFRFEFTHNFILPRTRRFFPFCGVVK